MPRGKGKGGRGGARSANKGGSRGGSTAGQADRWVDTPNTNVKFEAFYKAQGILPDEEWDQMIAAFHAPLPTTFRITGSRPIAASLNKLIEETYVPFLSGLEHEGVPLTPPRSLPWYPNGYAWQLNIAKQQIRKNEAFRKFQNFLVYETDAGNISRQEAVSMIPPLLLDILPHHYVLDMCAAPGSKSVQLLEALHTFTPTLEDPLSTIPPGLLIANDSDAKRCHMLVHQSLHRIPAAGMMVSNHDATQLPGLRLPISVRQVDENGLEVPVEVGPKQKFQSLLYDRILADVPCSGDGTLRKNLGIWRDWSPGNGQGLHALQLRILLRGIALLRPGGRLVYSTCSLNPIENEAVVSAALEASPSMSILAVPHLLPELKRRPGLTTWKVLDKDMNSPTHPSLIDETTVPIFDHKGRKKTFAPSLWPNGKEAERGLDRCLRIYPHLQDTGGFFVCVLIKAEETEMVDHRGAREEFDRAAEVVASTSTAEPVKRTLDDRSPSPVPEQPESKRAKADDVVAIEEDTPVEPEAALSVAVVDDFDTSELPVEIVGAGKVNAQFKEEPFTYLADDDEQVKLCIDFFDLSPSFAADSMLVRNATGEALRTIYFTSPLVRSLLTSNSYNRMRLISCGVKIFMRQDSTKDGTYRCKWRVMNEGLEVLRPFMGPKRIVFAKEETLRKLMESLNLKFDELDDPVLQEKLATLDPGSCVLQVDSAGKDVGLQQSLFLPFWRSSLSVNLMVEKVEKSALSLRLYGVDITPHAPKPKPVVVEPVVVEESTSEPAVAESETAVVVDAVVADTIVEPTVI